MWCQHGSRSSPNSAAQKTHNTTSLDRSVNWLIIVFQTGRNRDKFSRRIHFTRGKPQLLAPDKIRYRGHPGHLIGLYIMFRGWTCYTLSQINILQSEVSKVLLKSTWTFIKNQKSNKNYWNSWLWNNRYHWEKLLGVNYKVCCENYAELP